ncbi:MAG: hypothetical protein V2A34_14000 [Lentisphaerota bacterium]
MKRRNQNDRGSFGKAVDKWADDAVSRMRSMGIADLERITPASRMITSIDAEGKKAVRWVRTGSGTSDFVGTLYGGIFVRVEVKSHALSTLTGRSRMNIQKVFAKTPQEIDSLDRTIQFGGLAFLLVAFEGLDGWFLWPWGDIRDIQRREFLVPSLGPDPDRKVGHLFLEGL